MEKKSTDHAVDYLDALIAGNGSAQRHQPLDIIWNKILHAIRSEDQIMANVYFREWLSFVEQLMADACNAILDQKHITNHSAREITLRDETSE
jgi:hypothetical protein